MSDSASIVAETAARIFADLADPQTINQAKTADWKVPLWRALEQAGLTLAWVPDDLGGAGASLGDGFEVLSAAGRAAAGVALAETLLAGWLLAQGKIAAPPGMMTVAPARPGERIALGADGTLSGRARAVPFAGDALHIAVLAHGPGGTSIALVDAKACRVGEGRTLAGDAQSDVTFDRTKLIKVVSAPEGLDQTVLMLMGCTVRATQVAGALEAVLAMAVRYANERVAFERPIAKFQAVQHNLARLAGEVSAAMTAAGSAADAIARGEADDRSSVPRGGIGQDPLRRRPPRRVPPSRIRCMAPSASRKNISCIATPYGCWLGVTISAMRATGLWSWASAWHGAAPTSCGHWLHRGEWHDGFIHHVRHRLTNSPVSSSGSSRGPIVPRVRKSGVCRYAPGPTIHRA